MTKAEAIAQLKMDRDLCNFNPMTGEEEPMNEDCRKSAEALDMAIDALSQESSEDVIGRRAAIEAIKNIKAIKGTSDDKILLIDKAEAQTELMMLPSAQSEH